MRVTDLYTWELEAVEDLENLLFDNGMNARSLERFVLCGGSCVLEEREGVVAGYVLYVNAVECVDLSRLAVSPVYEGCGIGTALLQHVLDLGRPVLLCVEKTNQRALTLYKKHGFHVVGDYSSDNRWVMSTAP